MNSKPNTYQLIRPDYEALDNQGIPYTRPAQTIDELATPADRMAALESATREIAWRKHMKAVDRIRFGTPVFKAFGMTRNQAKVHTSSELLLARGASLSLDYCPEYSAAAGAKQLA